MSDVKIPELTEFLLGLSRTLVKEVGLGPRDLNTLSCRTRAEGISFLTKTLPKLWKAFDEGLSTGLFNLPAVFKRRWRGKEIPAFCGALFLRVFDRDGKLRDSPCKDAISAIRQIGALCYKVVTPLSDEKAEECYEAFCEVDSSLSDSVPNTEVLRRARILIGHILKGFSTDAIRPKHGPGVTSDVKITDKYESIPDRNLPLVRHFGIHHWMTPYQAASGVELSMLLSFVAGLTGFYPAIQLPQKLVAKVIAVPKDSRGPRIISAEPCHNQFIQQGMMAWTVDRLESHTFTRGLVNFTDQSVNQRLALEGSATKEWSTLDLKEASDRVSLALVKELYELVPEYLQALLACRTSSTKIAYSNGERFVKLKKFAPMGSAVCFTTLALSVWALSVAEISITEGYQQAMKSVTVFGDDVCVKTPYANRVIEALESHGLLVNKNKSFVNSRFLESCGVDAFDGCDVTPIKLKHCVSPETVSSTDIRLASMVAAANNLSEKGYPVTANYIFSAVERKLGKLPFGDKTSGFLCRVVKDYRHSMNRTKLKTLARGSKVRAYKTMDLLRSHAGHDQVHTLLAWQIESPKTDFEETGWGRLRRIIRLMGQELETPDYGEMVLPRNSRLRKRTVTVAM